MTIRRKAADLSAGSRKKGNGVNEDSSRKAEDFEPLVQPWGTNSGPSRSGREADLAATGVVGSPRRHTVLCLRLPLPGPAPDLRLHPPGAIWHSPHHPPH